MRFLFAMVKQDSERSQAEVVSSLDYVQIIRAVSEFDRVPLMAANICTTVLPN
jgi:hypothetical protein